MADKENEQAQDVDAKGGGQQPEKTFTQAELDAIIADRLSRQKKQYEDYDDLKDKASKWQRFLDEQKSEIEKMNDAVRNAQRERDEALQRAQARLIRAAFVAEAAQQGAAHPDDVYALADLSSVALDDQDNVVGVAEAVKAIIEAGRVPMAQGPRAPSLDGGAGSGQRPAEAAKVALSQDEEDIARKLRISPEDYAKRKQELQKQQAAR
jgi:hypothetical protein